MWNGIAEFEKEMNLLLEYEISSEANLKDLLTQSSKVFDYVDELLMRKYIKYQLDTTDEKVKEDYIYSQQNIKPVYKKYKEQIEEKIYQNRHYFTSQYYQYLCQRIENTLLLINDKNIEIEIIEDNLITKYFNIRGEMIVNWQGEDIPVDELYGFLYDDSRELREEALKLMCRTYSSKEKELQLLLDEMIALRTQKAENAGLKNYRDYMFKKYERFNYTHKDCENLGESVRKYVLPLINKFHIERKNKLQLDCLKPWDTRVDCSENNISVPYESVSEMINRAKELLNNISPSFSELLKRMKETNCLDLESRIGKAPGGFCEFLPSSKSSFIMLNLVNTKDNLPIFLHEMGHCIHHDLMSDIELSEYKQLPMETAELAAMSMELFTLENWASMYKNQEEFKYVKKELFKQILEFIPITLVVDQFQQWLYTTPDHTHEDRKLTFQRILEKYESDIVNWEGVEEWKKLQWLDVIHLFETPFYYIEYAIAQLGSLQLYRNFKKDPRKTIKQFTEALSLGSSKSVSEIYRVAGIEFNISEQNIKDLMEFVENEINSLEVVN
ncbi:M3 family oligoendopeptidase [Bacillus mycoides]|uniref:M3 family oligoendopeptidase n=1 Tax=Bacillus TaxID=1386 RepID=UPI00032F0690|nr:MULTISPECIES: M3 family oligoendopeptidase [Bacillus cereus group]EOP68624.1 M3 family oligoendopeptidase [Bacillus cereus VDM006]MDF2086460.1 M3 family oligoendopeptidase [Bacillus pseudomycoides]WJE75884.1 M3 family oligoendopeptidase [Bacillus mycoides]